LTSLPANFGQLTHLRLLDLSENQLTTLPESITKLKHLQCLIWGRNPFTPFSKSINLWSEELEKSGCSIHQSIGYRDFKRRSK
ncbi:MAG: leucine-rich repeat domain-containing protein, partial [Candidatus Hodarchaeales archaeon]